MGADAAIRALLEEAAAALRTGDWSRYQAVWAHEPWIELIHPAEGEWLRGWEAVGKGYRELLEAGARPDLQRLALHVRVAPCGSWRIVHAHAFVPASPAPGASGQADVSTHVTIPTLRDRATPPPTVPSR